jgi:hypothetical protein
VEPEGASEGFVGVPVKEGSGWGPEERSSRIHLAILGVIALLLAVFVWDPRRRRGVVESQSERTAEIEKALAPHLGGEDRTP